jgi:P27 family predicted phage terminase small subunit
MRGRKPTPTALRIVRGNPGKRPLPRDEAQLPPAVEAPPPRELAGDAGALAEWLRLEPMLRTSRVLTDGDRAALVAACQQWSRYLTASAEVQTGGLLVKPTPRSKARIPNPYLPIANKALTLCVRLWAELGLTPSSRTRVAGGVGDPRSAAELDNFLLS